MIPPDLYAANLSTVTENNRRRRKARADSASLAFETPDGPIPGGRVVVQDGGGIVRLMRSRADVDDVELGAFTREIELPDADEFEPGDLIFIRNFSGGESDAVEIEL